MLSQYAESGFASWEEEEDDEEEESHYIHTYGLAVSSQQRPMGTICHDVWA